MKTEFVIRDSSAKMPNSCMGRYRRVAVLEVESGTIPRMISTRAPGVVRVVETWEKLNVGRTDRCAFARAMAEARELVARLNAEREV